MKNRKIIVFLLAITMILGQSFIFTEPVKAASTDLVITGTGITKDITITTEDWSKYKLIEKLYSTNNSLNFHKIVKAKGYDLFELIGTNNLKTDIDYQVKFTCADGFEFTKTISELKNTYYYNDFTEVSKVKSTPMIAKYTAILADFPKDSFSPPITWTDRAIKENDKVKDFPKLVFGQTSIDDMNMSKWGKEVVKITIGDEKSLENEAIKSQYKHISYSGAPYNIDAISSATFTIEGSGVEGYRAVSLRQIEEDVKGQEQVKYYEKINNKIVQNTYEGINAKYLIDKYVKVKSNAGNIIFKNKSRKPILTIPIEEAGNYTVAYGINQVPLVYLDTDVGYRADKYNDNGCFKLVYNQGNSPAKELSNVAYIYIEEKDAKNIYEHTYEPYNDSKYTDYEIIIHGDKIDKEVRYTVSDIEKMKDIQIEEEYSLSNSEYFWYYNKYKGVTLWELLLKAGIEPNIDESTSIQFIAADNYNFAPMTIKEIKDSSLYGYYEKDASDKGDGTFNGGTVKPLHSGMPVMVAYGFNGYPYVTRPTDDGFNPGLGNDGGPLRVIFGKTSYNDTNGSNQVQFIKEIIIGGGTPISTSTGGSGDGETTYKDVAANSSWDHNQSVYVEYLDMPVLRITGSQVKEPVTLTLRQIESMKQYAIRDVYSGDGIRELEGVILWDIISKVVGLKDGVETPSIRVFSGQNYNQILRSNEQVINGVLNSQGKLKEIILAYAVEGYPLVPNEGSTGYVNNNAYGPLRLIIEENKSMWVKWIDCIVVGTGDYEAPEMKDVKELDVLEPDDFVVEEEITSSKTWLTYKNNTGKELTEASVRSMEFDKDGNLWIGTNNGGISVRTPEGKWENIKELATENVGTVNVDTSYAIVQRENGELWVTLGSPVSKQGILVKTNETWKLLNTENSLLPSSFVQELELDGAGGLWIGTENGAVHIDKNNEWKVYTQEDGLLPYSVDAIEPDGKGGTWLGYYPDTKGDKENPIYIGGYQHIAEDGKITTYEGFDNTNFNMNWVRSISIDSKGGCWVVRSGNAPGFGQGEIDYILNGKTKVYTAKELYPGITEQDDIRFVLADKEIDGTIYIATLSSGVIKAEGIGKVTEKINASNQFPSKQWNNVYFMDLDEGNLLIGTNGGAAIYTDSKTFVDTKSHWAQKEIENMATMGYISGSNGKYRPDEDITKAEFFALMVKILGPDKTGDTIVSEPNSPISRQEIGVIIGNALNDHPTEEQLKEILSSYKVEVPESEKASIVAALKAEIIKGFPDKTFRGDLNVTRAQAAVMLFRFLKY